MNALNSTADIRRAAVMTGVGVLMAFLLLAPAFSSAASYQLSVTTDKTIYNPGATITISGSVTPAPSSGTYVTISIYNPSGTLVDHLSALVGASGSYSATSVASGVGGAYTVKALWAANLTATPIVQTSQFELNSTTSSATGVGTTTTVHATTTVVESSVTTVSSQVTTTVSAQTTTTISSQVTTTVVQSSSDTGTILGAVGIVIAVIAGAIGFLALRKH